MRGGPEEETRWKGGPYVREDEKERNTSQLPRLLVEPGRVSRPEPVLGGRWRKGVYSFL